MKFYFIDSNIIVYANDRQAGTKQDQAIDIVQRLIRGRHGVISTQVMQEYAQVALSKLSQDSAVILRQLRLLERLIVSPLTAKTTRRAVEIVAAYRISFWDANIVAAAEAAECDFILSEDLNTGQFYAGLQVINPFVVPQLDL